MTALDTLRQSLPPPGTARFWRALDELVDDPARRPLLHAAWPALAEMEPALDRRGFLKLLGASLAFAGLAACSGPPPEHIVPELGRNGRQTPSTARYATALATGGDVVGVIVELRDGRPVRVDGNARHPASLGGSDARMQASILDLWDPARSDAPRQRGTPASWAGFEEDAATTLRARLGTDGHGFCVVSGALDSPTLIRQREALLQRYPAARWFVHDPAAGRAIDVSYDLSKAALIVALDADPLGTMPGHLRHARDFAAHRSEAAPMSRLYAMEPTPSLTGRNADHAWPVASADIPRIATALAAAVAGAGVGTGPSQQRIESIATDLLAHRGASLVMAGPYQPDEVHAAVRAINHQLGNNGVTVIDAVTAGVPSPPMTELVSDMHAGRVDTLLVLETNPAYSAPGFTEAVSRVAHTVHLGRYRDETALLSEWHLPALHPFETWSDLQAGDGTASIVQPVLAPLVDGRSSHDLIDLVLGSVADDPRARVRATWPDLARDDAWTAAVRDGVFRPAVAASSPSQSPISRPASATAAPGMASAALAPDKSLPSETLELIFRPDEFMWDGRHAENAWLQELPRPVTSLTWGNALHISPALAEARGLADGDSVRIDVDGRHIEAPVLIVPGQAPSTVTAILGYGRREGLGGGHGYDAYALRADDQTWCAKAAATLTKLGQREMLASTQLQQDMARRDIIRVGTPDAPPHFEPTKPLPTFYADAPPGEYRWGMSIDLNACIGCNACTVACQAENNIPVVGKEEVVRGRRMHWIRVDRYHEGPASAPRTYHQPVPCMHCEHAPCEVVCPVEATVHDSEGLNLQVYNRCVGTRFCANNCPYKVRRFNFLQYADFANESLKAMRNPEVTVRQKGVMEKCTYCVQRIEGAHIAADRDDRPIAEGEVTTACQVACPTQAIVFGDLARADSAVSKASQSPRRYVLLEELNTRPRTSYLAALRNPNPAWRDA